MDVTDSVQEPVEAPAFNERLLNAILELLPSRFAKPFAAGFVCEPGVTVKTPSRLTVGKNVVVQRNSILHCGGKSWSDYRGSIELSDGVIVGPGVNLYGAGTIKVGAYSHFGPGSMVMTQSGNPASLDRQSPAPGHLVEPVVIGRGVWIGAGAVVLGGSVLGDNCVVSPNSVVSGTYDAGSTLIGNPARVVRKRSEGPAHT